MDRVRVDRALLGDAALGAAVSIVVAVAIAMDLGSDRGPDALAYLFAICLGALMLVRRRFPVLALVATAAGLLAYYVAGYPPIGTAIPVVAALYSAAEAGRLRWAIGVGTGLVVVSSFFRVREGDSLAYLFGYELASTLGLMAAAIALGDGVRNRRLLREHAAEEREREAAKRVEEERLRIARELHDSIGHTIAVVSVQTDVATEALQDGHPDRTEAALRLIRESTDRAGGEIASTLGVLRGGHDRTPTGTLDQLDPLVASIVESGLPVSVRVEKRRELPFVVDAAAYRIVQEALTNALRHAGADHADVLLDFTPERLEITVHDNGRGCVPGDPARHNGGRGIRGMRERARVLGGTVELESGNGEPGTTVRASLPLEVA